MDSSSHSTLHQPLLPPQQAPPIQIRYNLLDRILHPGLLTPNMNVRPQRLLIRRTDARKVLDDPLPRLLIQPLGIPPLRLLNTHIYPNLNKRQARLSAFFSILTRAVPRLFV